MQSMSMVSVVMPVYNAALYLEAAINSVLEQTFRDFEFIIINDGSTDGSVDILDRFQKQDKRIRVCHHLSNLGVIAALNAGCKLAGGKYIARMDADDISLTERFSKQVDFMDNNPDVGVCGTWMRLFGERNEEWRMPVEAESVRCKLLFFSPLMHPTVMMRKSLMDKHNLYYREGFDHAEDYDLWERFSHYCPIMNIPEVLLLYRIHANQVTQRKIKDIGPSSSLVRRRQLAKLGIMPDDTEWRLHLSIIYAEHQTTKKYVCAAEDWLCKLMDVNTSIKLYDETVFSQAIYDYWSAVCRNATYIGLWTLKKFFKSRLVVKHFVPLRSWTTLAIECGLKRPHLFSELKRKYLWR